MADWENAKTDLLQAKKIDPTLEAEVNKVLNEMKKNIEDHKEKEKKLWKSVFEKGITGSDAPTPSQTNVGFAERILTSLLAPGINNDFVMMMNGIFVLLLILSAFFIWNNPSNIHVYVFFVLSLFLFLTIQWFLSQVTLKKSK